MGLSIDQYRPSYGAEKAQNPDQAHIHTVQRKCRENTHKPKTILSTDIKRKYVQTHTFESTLTFVVYLIVGVFYRTLELVFINICSRRHS